MAVTTPISDRAAQRPPERCASSRDGTIVLWPSPRLDLPSAFSFLLHADAGHGTMRLRGRAQASRRNRDGTLVLETTLQTARGRVRLTDALAFSPGARGHEIARTVPQALVHAAVAMIEAGERQAVEA